MAFILQDDQQAELSVTYQDAAGNAAVVDGPTTWTSSDESVLTVTASEDGSTATMTAVGPLGTAQIQSSGDADLGEGVVPVLAVLDVELVASEAVTAVITPGEPTDK